MTTTLHPEWRQAAKDIAEQFKYGDLVSMEWLQKSFHLIEPKTIDQFKNYQLEFLSCMDALRQELLEEHRLILRNVRGAGYEVVAPNEQVEFAWQAAFGKVKQELGKLAGALRHIRHEELSDEKRKEHSDAQAKLCGVSAFVRREGKRKQALIKAS